MGKKRGAWLLVVVESMNESVLQLKAALAALEADLEDLEESVKYEAHAFTSLHG
jgi:hypothetical protein